jgi:SAM-dependent methyltransferase
MGVRPPRASMTEVFSGAGPGARTRDGCSVELYRELPYLGELDDILGELGERVRILELGCGAGRLTRRLIAHGRQVTAVDDSPEMLSALPAGATGVLGDIAQLDLADRFDVAILASCLINHPDAQVRAAFLRAAHRHLVQGGRLFVQRHDPHWLRNARAGDVHGSGSTTITVEHASRSGDLVRMTIRYDRPRGTWWHSFSAAALSTSDAESALRDAGFRDPVWYGQARRWLGVSV